MATGGQAEGEDHAPKINIVDPTREPTRSCLRRHNYPLSIAQVSNARPRCEREPVQHRAQTVMRQTSWRCDRLHVRNRMYLHSR